MASTLRSLVASGSFLALNSPPPLLIMKAVRMWLPVKLPAPEPWPKP